MPPIDGPAIEDGLHRLGVSPGDLVEVHSSLSRFGLVKGGAAAVVDALFGVVGPTGTIVMSAYPLSRSENLTPEDLAMGITYKSRVLPDDSRERTNLGAVVDEFRFRPGVVCGTGSHRSCAWGMHAERHISGYTPLIQAGGSVLLLGVGIGSCSSMHVPEEDIGIPPTIQAFGTPPPDVAARYPADSWYVECSRVTGPPRDAWGAIWVDAVSAGLVRTVMIGEAECHRFIAADVVGIYAHRLREDPWTLFGVNRPGDDR